MEKPGASRKTQVRFTDKLNIDLLRHVIAENPFSGMDSAKKWGVIAEAMSNGNSLFTARTVRERTIRTLNQFSSEESANMKKSGEDECIDEVTVLKQECLDLKREADVEARKVKEQKELEKNSDEDKIKDIRKRALEGLSKDDQDGRGGKRVATIQYLRDKCNAENALREREIDLKSRELALSERRFELEREERRSQLELQKQQSNAMFKLLEKMNKD